MAQGLKCIAIALVVASLAVSGSVPALAVPAAACDKDVRDALNNRKDAAAVRDDALAAGVITRPEPTAGLSCMDQALGVTARLGHIFSDRHDDMVPPANTEVFTPKLAYPDWGATDFLLFNLNDTVMPMLGKHMGSNFGGTLGSVFGTTALSGKVGNLVFELMEKEGNPITKINDTMMSFTEKIESVRSAISAVQKLAKMLNLPMPSPVIIGTVAALEAAQKVVDKLMEQVQKALNAIIQPLIGQVMGQIMSPAADMECNNIATLWNGGDGKRITSITGSGATSDIPFMPMSQVLSGKFARTGGGAADVFQSSWNTDILSRALNDLSNGALAAPGKSPSWVTPPTFGRVVTPEEVIEQMKAQAR